jgi:hypothetical protein
MSFQLDRAKAVRDRRPLYVTLAIGIAIAAVAALSGGLDAVGDRAPIAVLGGGGFAFGGAIVWLLNSRRR